MKQIIFLFTLATVLLLACGPKPDNPCDPSIAANLPAVAIDSVYRSGDQIIISGNVLQLGQDDAGLSAHGVVWSQNLTPSLQNGTARDLGATTATGRFTVTLDSLLPGDYQFRSYATNCTGTQYSSQVKNLMVTVQGKPFVQVNDHYLFSATGNDGIINPGDAVVYGFTLQNVGTLKATAITATLYTAAAPYINGLGPASFNIGTLNANGAISAPQTLAFSVAANTPAGSYCLSLDIDADGEMRTDTMCFEVIQKVSADFAIQNDGCKAPCTTSFSNTSQGAVSYVWNFGDGSSSTAANPGHLYKKFGQFPVQLIATGLNNIKDTITKMVTIAPRTFATSIVKPGWQSIYVNTIFEQTNGEYLLALKIEGVSNFKFSGLMPVDIDGVVDYGNLVQAGGDRIKKIDDENFLYCSTNYPFNPQPGTATFGKVNITSPGNPIEIKKSRFKALDIALVGNKVYFAGSDDCIGSGGSELFSRFYRINNEFQTTDSVQIITNPLYCDPNCSCSGEIPAEFVVIGQNLFFISPYGLTRKAPNESLLKLRNINLGSSADHLISTSDGHLVCYNTDTGLVFKMDINGTLKWEKDFTQTFSCIAAKSNGNLIAVDANNLYEINSTTGQINWTKALPWTESTESPVVFETSDGGLLIAGNAGVFTKVNILKTDDNGSL